MEEEWVVDRARLRDLRWEHPEWTQRQLADRLGRSLGWVKKWTARLRQTDAADERALHRRTSPHPRPRIRRTPRIIDRVLAIRDQPPDNLQRVPGPRAILYYLTRDEALRDCPDAIPRSTRTIWQILDEAGRIERPLSPRSEPLERAAPLQAWQVDWKDATTVPPELDGKHLHMVEILNVVDTGTSILLDSLPRADYTAETALLALTHVLLLHGCPTSITFDRDTRLVGSWSAGEFPSTMVRHLWNLGIQAHICPPRQPNKNAFVERFHRSLEEECLQVHRPATLEEVRRVTEDFKWHYNHERPNQATSCGDKPPYAAFPVLPQLPPLPDQVDPDHWLLRVHRQHYKRRVGADGSIRIGKHAYYVSTKLRGRLIVFSVDAYRREFVVEVEGKPVKRLAIKGLHGGPLPFQDYLKLMCQEAVTEQRLLRRLAARRRVYD